MSIVLFISATALIDYALMEIEKVKKEVPYDIQVRISDEETEEYLGWYEINVADNKKISNSYWYCEGDIWEFKDTKGMGAENKKILEEYEIEYANVIAIGTQEYNKLLSKMKLLNDVDAIAIGCEHKLVIEGDGYRTEEYSLFQNTEIIEIQFDNIDEAMKCSLSNIKIIEEVFPLEHLQDGLTIILPVTEISNYEKESLSFYLYLNALDHKGVSEMLKNSKDNISIHNVAKDYENQTKSMLVIDFFANIFIILISLISIVNVYFTIRTNIYTQSKRY